MKPRATTSPILALTALAVSVLLVLCSDAQAQTVIEPGPPGTLNETILGDTTAAGVRNSCHYVLRRDAVYIYNQRISMRADCEWIIEAEAGSGERPIIRAAALPGGEEAPRPFHLFANTTLRLKSLYVDSYDTSLPEPGIPTDNATLRVGADSASVYIDDVRFDRNRQSTIRTDNSQVSVYVTNSQFSNNHNVNRPDQSYIFDTRGNDADSVVFVNNTIWNHTGVVVNNAQEINYIKWDHNTFVNIGGTPNASARLDTLRIEEPGEDDMGVISFGQAKYGVFRNNLLHNVGVIATETQEFFVPRFVVDIDSALIEVDSVTFDMIAPEGVDIRNNVISWDDNIATGYPDTIRAYGEADFYDPTLDLFIDAQGSSSTLIASDVEFTSFPDVPPSFVTDFYLFATGAQEREPLRFPGDTRNPGGEGSLDFSYSTGAAAYTAAENGMPAGDLNAFAMAEGYTSGPDQFSSLTPTSTEAQELPGEFALDGNYPNPFNPSTNIQFDLPTAADVTIEVFDLLGRKVRTLATETMQAGQNQRIEFDASALASGIYLYRVTAESVTDRLTKTGRMILLK